MNAIAEPKENPGAKGISRTSDASRRARGGAQREDPERILRERCMYFFKVKAVNWPPGAGLSSCRIGL